MDLDTTRIAILVIFGLFWAIPDWIRLWRERPGNSSTANQGATMARKRRMPPRHKSGPKKGQFKKRR